MPSISPSPDLKVVEDPLASTVGSSSAALKVAVPEARAPLAPGE